MAAPTVAAAPAANPAPNNSIDMVSPGGTLVSVRLAVTLLVALAAVPAANGQLVRTDRLTEMAATVAGRPVDIACEDSNAAWASGPAPAANAYYSWDSDYIRLAPSMCDLAQMSGSSLVGPLLFVVAHEAAHARGVRSEAWADCYGLLWTADLARRFYSVEFYTARSDELMRQAVAYHRGAPADYQGLC